MQVVAVNECFRGGRDGCSWFVSRVDDALGSCEAAAVMICPALRGPSCRACQSWILFVACPCRICFVRMGWLLLRLSFLAWCVSLGNLS